MEGKRAQIAHVQLPFSPETLLSEKNYRPIIKLWLFDKKKKNQLPTAIIEVRLQKSAFSWCQAPLCTDTCVISLSGMAITKGFL